MIIIKGYSIEALELLVKKLETLHQNLEKFKKAKNKDTVTEIYNDFLWEEGDKKAKYLSLDNSGEEVWPTCDTSRILLLCADVIEKLVLELMNLRVQDYAYTPKDYINYDKEAFVSITNFLHRHALSEPIGRNGFLTVDAWQDIVRQLKNEIQRIINLFSKE